MPLVAVALVLLVASVLAPRQQTGVALRRAHGHAPSTELVQSPAIMGLALESRPPDLTAAALRNTLWILMRLAIA